MAVSRTSGAASPIAVEPPEQGSKHEPRAERLDPRELHRLGIEAVALVAGMRARQPQPLDQLRPMRVVAQEVQRGAIGKLRDLGNLAPAGHERAVAAFLGEQRKRDFVSRSRSV